MQLEHVRVCCHIVDMHACMHTYVHACMHTHIDTDTAWRTKEGGGEIKGESMRKQKMKRAVWEVKVTSKGNK